MNNLKISLLAALQLEILRSNGISNEKIMKQIKTGNTEAWQELQPDFDYHELVDTANQDMEQFNTILAEGYQVKYLTYNGLRNLLRIRFGKEADRDYQLEEKAFRNLSLSAEELKQVKQMLSINWRLEVTEQENHFQVNIELA